MLFRSMVNTKQKIKRCIYCGKYYKDDSSLVNGAEFLTEEEEREVKGNIEIGQCSNPAHDDGEIKYYNNLSLYW